MTYIKILDAEGRSVHGGNYQWPLPKQDTDGKWTPGAWVEVEGEIEPCTNGLHATDEAHLWAWLTNVAWRAWVLAYEGDVIDADNKVVGRKAQLLRPFTLPEWWTSVKSAIEALKDMPWLVNDGDPNPEWRLFEPRDAARDAAWDAAWDADWDAAWDAARAAARDAARAAARDAAWAAARDAAWAAAWDAAWDAAGDAARAAARAAARDAARAAARAAAWAAARDAAWDAARDAARDAADQIAFTTICADLPIEQRHRDEIARRWRVWQKGYGLAAEVGGVLYVYKRIS